MAVYLSDRVLDNGLSTLSNEANRFDICSAAPSTFLEATDTNTLGNKTDISVGDPEDRTPDGRKVTFA